MRFVLDEEISQKLEAICHIMKEYPLDVVNRVVADYVELFENEDKQIAPKKAMLFTNTIGEHNQTPEGICYVLGKTTMLGQSYYKIYYDKQLMKVPKECIQFIE